MDKRGQVDKAITALPVFFAVAIVLIIFTLISAGVFGFKKISDNRDAAFSSVNMPILFETVVINNIEMTVLEAFRKYYDDEDKLGELFSKISDMTPQNGCLVFAYSRVIVGAPESVPYGIHSSMIDGEVTATDYGMDQGVSFFRKYEPYMDANLLQRANLKFTEDNSEFAFITYTGRCADE